jgi:hypothetical protein
MAPSDDDRSELLDDDALSAEYPPERPLGVNQYGTTAQEERVDEPLDERRRREQRGGGDADDPVLLMDETADGDSGGLSDLDAGETGDTILGETGEGSWGGDDAGPGLGPPPGELASDRVPLAAEESAVHVVDVEAEDDELQ